MISPQSISKTMFSGKMCDRQSRRRDIKQPSLSLRRDRFQTRSQALQTYHANRQTSLQVDCSVHVTFNRFTKCVAGPTSSISQHTCSSRARPLFCRVPGCRRPRGGFCRQTSDLCSALTVSSRRKARLRIEIEQLLRLLVVPTSLSAQ